VSRRTPNVRTTGGPLDGRTVLLTRRSAESTALTTALTSHGAHVDCLPTTRCQPTSADSPELAPLDEPELYNYVAFTSRPAASLFVELLQARLGPHRTPQALAAWRRRHIAAVGAGTRSALEDAGLPVRTLATPEEVSRVGGANALADQLLRETSLGRGDRVILPQSRIARPELRHRLQATGAVVDRVPLYDTVPEDVASATAFVSTAAHGKLPDVVIFLSPSAVHGFLQITAPHGETALVSERLRVVSIGATTSTALEEHGIPITAQATRPEPAALAQAVVRALE
jgi:uroporphyrinogen-III synthase